MPDFHITFRDLLHAVNLRHGTDGFTSPPKEGEQRNFSPWKIQRLRSGLNPRTWVPKASTLPLDHRSRLVFVLKWCVVYICIYITYMPASRKMSDSDVSSSQHLLNILNLTSLMSSFWFWNGPGNDWTLLLRVLIFVGFVHRLVLPLPVQWYGDWIRFALELSSNGDTYWDLSCRIRF